MSRVDSRFGAAVLIGLAATYLVISVVTGRSARAEVPPDLTPAPADAALRALEVATLLVEEPGTAVIDVRPADAFASYHLPGAVNLPGASVEDVVAAARRAPAAVLYAGKDEAAQKLVAAARAAQPAPRIHYLVDGARAWYLAFQLPVPLFSEAAPPPGWSEAVGDVNAWFAGGASSPGREAVIAALQSLAKASYQPDLLQGPRRPAASSGAKKKLSGGCG